ncbi:Imm49 family immunity protein [Haloarcula sp. H-GB5]
MVTQNKLRDRSDEKKSDVENSYWAIDNNREHGKPYTTALRALSHEAREIVSCELLLGNVTEAREWAARLALANRSFIHQIETRTDEISKSTLGTGGSRAMWGIFGAVLAGDERLIATLAAQMHSFEFIDRYTDPEEFYWCGSFLAALLADEPADAKHARNEFEQVLDDPGDHWRGTRDVQIGLIERDSDRVTNGIERILKHHREHVEDMPRWRELLSLSASVYVLVARDYGLEIDIESEYLPDAIREYSLDERISLPQPDYLKDLLRVPAGSPSAE